MRPIKREYSMAATLLKTFALAVVVCGGILIVIGMLSRSGSGFATTRVHDFSLCASDGSRYEMKTKPRLPSTSVVYVCGNLEMEGTDSVRLNIYLRRNGDLRYARDYRQSFPGNFIVAIETTELLSTGTYSITVLDAARRLWEEVVVFEIR